MGMKARRVPKKVQIKIQVGGDYGPGLGTRVQQMLCANSGHDKRYTGMAKLNEDTWQVGFRCARAGCPHVWGEKLSKIDAHEQRQQFWGPGFAEDVEQYIAMINGWKAKKAQAAAG